jgi:hypothetical protein
LNDDQTNIRHGRRLAHVRASRRTVEPDRRGRALEGANRPLAKDIGNDKRPRIRLPEGWSNDGQTPVERRERKPKNDRQTTIERTVASVLVIALRAHVETLKAELETLKAQFTGAETRVSEEGRQDRAGNRRLRAIDAAAPSDGGPARH